MKKLAIFGIGEFAMIAYEYFTHDSDYQVSCFVVDDDYKSIDELYKLPVFSREYFINNSDRNEIEIFVAIPCSDMNQTRTRIYQDFKSIGYKFASYVSSSSFIWRNASVGENTFIFENNTIQPFVEIGNNVILWSGNHIGHRTKIHDNVFVSSHVVISGYCEINQNCFLGVNSTFNDNINLPAFSLVASGSLINKNFSESQRIIAGSPGKIIGSKDTKKMVL